MEFDESKVIVNPAYLVRGDKYIVAKDFQGLAFNVGKKDNSLDTVTFCDVESNSGCDDYGNFWNFWYPTGKHGGVCRPYSVPKLEWVGKCVISVGNRKSGFVINQVNADDGEKSVCVCGRWLDLGSFFAMYLWLDKTPCGEKEE